MNGKIAIVGGGISGLYAAYRLLERYGDCDVTIYEKTGEVGGRIHTARFGIFDDKSADPLTELNAELGAMRFPREHRMLFDLCRHLKIDNVDQNRPSPWRGPFEFRSLYQLRGRTLSREAFRSGKIPYRVRPEEGGKTPDELLEYAILRMLQTIIDDDTKAGGGAADSKKLQFLKEFQSSLKNHEVLSASRWVAFIKYDYEFAGIPLRNIGFWNVLKHFLGSEAFLLAHDGFGFLSVISNWSALEAFKWLLTDFSPHQRFQTIPGGVGQVILKLRQELARLIKPFQMLREIVLERKGCWLRFGDTAKEWFDHVVLAMPPNALGKIHLFDGQNELAATTERNWRKLIHCSRPHRLAKIVLAYEEPWWQHTRIPGADAGRLFTDLPVRQIYYLGPKWLAENGWTHKASRHSLVMVYNDSHYEAFWRAFHVHDKVFRNEDEPLDRTLGRLPEEIMEGAARFFGPRKIEEYVALMASNPTPDERKAGLQRIKEIADKYEVRHRMEEKVRAQLSELHEYDVPMAIGGIYRDWSDEGGWHTWEPFVDVPKVKEIIVQPFVAIGDNVAIRSLGKPIDENSVPLYICGEAYSWEQGWIEGALMTAERVVSVMAKSPCEAPKWFCGGDNSRYEQYMYAELPVDHQKQLDQADAARKRAEARREIEELLS